MTSTSRDVYSENNKSRKPSSWEVDTSVKNLIEPLRKKKKTEIKLGIAQKQI